MSHFKHLTRLEKREIAQTFESREDVIDWVNREAWELAVRSPNNERPSQRSVNRRIVAFTNIWHEIVAERHDDLRLLQEVFTFPPLEAATDAEETKFDDDE